MALRTATVLALLAVPLASGCGNDERDSVERYIMRANAVQARYQAEFQHANEAYAKFAQGELSSRRANLDLTAAEQALRDARAQLARVEPPASAAELHRRLLRGFTLNAELAAESTALARYLPAARKVLRRVGRIGKRLRSRLRAAKTPEAQGDALGDYARAIRRQYDALYVLKPPPIVVSTHRVQLGRLSSSSRLALQLRAATRARDSGRVARLLLEFRRVSRRSGDRRMARRAMREYNARYRDINRAAAAIQREQGRLERRLG